VATDPPVQRAYRAACPNCGAPVEFRSPASAFAVCSFCKSTIVREGDALRKIGESADLFDDHSPLQLGASGQYQGARFTLVGRLQYRYAEGTWNEWHALFETRDGQKSGWLSEDNGRYVFAFDAPLAERVPPATELRPGAQLLVGGQAWSIASVTAARLLAAQGELPAKPILDRGFLVADLRNARDEVGTLDYGEPQAPRWSIGRSVALSELALTGLAEIAEKTLKGRGAPCPSCGAPLEIKLQSTQSIVCNQCKAVVDISQGIGGDLAHYEQAGGREPQIPLGTVGTFAFGKGPELPWQVVGYVERCTVPGGGGAGGGGGGGSGGGTGGDDDEDDDDDEQSFWREYLLYHRTAGFTFLVDAEDGWSWAAPITGAPERAGTGVRWQGTVYKRLYAYTGKVTYVLGEFYWQLKRDELTRNVDYQGIGGATKKRLNREQTASEGIQEVVWSAGETLEADAVVKAFRLAPDQTAALQRDVKPTSGSGGGLLAKVFLWAFIVVVVLMLFRCGDDDNRTNCESTRLSYGDSSQEYRNCLNSSGGGSRTGGGAFGGFSSGGGHK
jgi:hypothetical protein